ncbi:carboxymuconolactone decarboxylase family protein [Aurantimonas sp. Leaf443]|uniref:carboxymuconolactone decarboxylase family protein n=1 Tax=Aurantimonas sp. Leaf443 TaxID=1736378 RepID=UPI0006FA5EFC|nr:carboxymuconolactone decarboxylase family protein [Aurantimonas sp. Leaf443]KQT86858.1 4-carboxymuconolactone decarboxylase [Aurantimonas sp. Leaf443]
MELDTISPALGHYRATVLDGDLWTRSRLSPRDRSIVTVAALIARREGHELARQIERALDHGVTPGEISEMATHLAFYSGWGSGTLASTVASAVFAKRGFGSDRLPGATVDFLPIDEAFEAQRVATVDSTVVPTFQTLVDDTTAVLFRDLWLRPGLAPRDRSLTTMSALIAAGQFPQITYHLNKAMENGLTEEEAAEAISHLAFYAGWPNAMSSVPVAKAVFENRR